METIDLTTASVPANATSKKHAKRVLLVSHPDLVELTGEINLALSNPYYSMPHPIFESFDVDNRKMFNVVLHYEGPLDYFGPEADAPVDLFDPEYYANSGEIEAERARRRDYLVEECCLNENDGIVFPDELSLFHNRVGSYYSLKDEF